VPTGLYVGLMSGTSMDGIDAALVEFGSTGIRLHHTLEHPISRETRDSIAAISHSGDNEIERLGRLDRQLGALFAHAVTALLADAGVQSKDIAAIGSHGQTIRHRPTSAGTAPEHSFTLQIGDPNTIAELTGITTIADFRRRDIAAGGEGAPLAPAFHAAAFAKAGSNRAVVNIGGIANASLLQSTQLLQGFDTGPGNTLLDLWIERHQGVRYDQHGQWSAEGEICEALLDTLLAHPYLGLSGPRSTGKEAFNMVWLDACLQHHDNISPQSVQATLAQLTARTIANALASNSLALNEIYICGGGAHNTDLMRRLNRLLQPATLDSTAALGMDPDWVEAAAFAWLAMRRMTAQPGNAPVVTGASGERVLGSIYPG
jgi:anhydro-N-acetylmuramic acid kinase